MTSLTFQFVAFNTNVAGFLYFGARFRKHVCQIYSNFTVLLMTGYFLESEAQLRHERDAFFPVSARLGDMSVRLLSASPHSHGDISVEKLVKVLATLQSS